MKPAVAINHVYLKKYLNLTGDYTWQTTGRLAQGKFRALRPFAAAHL
jgi:hypothetical protein